MAVATFTTSQCSASLSSLSLISSGTCYYSQLYQSYYQVTSDSSTTASYSFGCSTNSTNGCTNCQFTGSGDDNDCTTVNAAQNIYGIAWQLDTTSSLVVSIYTDPACTQVVGSSLVVTSSSCQFSTTLQQYYFVAQTTSGNYLAEFLCIDPTCSTCIEYALASSIGACIPVYSLTGQQYYISFLNLSKLAWWGIFVIVVAILFCCCCCIGCILLIVMLMRPKHHHHHHDPHSPLLQTHQ